MSGTRSDRSVRTGTAGGLRAGAGRLALGASGVVAIVLVWAAAARLLDQRLILPGPVETLTVLLAQLRTAAFYAHLGMTAVRAVAGFLLSLAAGLVWGVAAGLNVRIRSFLAPALVLIRSTPVIAVILLAIIWFSPSAAPVLVTWLMVMPVVEQSVEHGVRTTGHALLEMATVYRVPRGRVLREVHVPSLRPYVRAAAHSGLGIAYKVTVAAEVLVQPPWSIGGAMQEARFYLDTPRIIALTLTVIVLSGITEAVLRRFDRLVDPTLRARASGPESSAIDSQSLGYSGALQPSTETGEVVFDLRRVRKSYDRLLVLDDVSLEVCGRRVTALLGPSGCGKTTLLRIVAGLEQQDGGVVTANASQLSMVFQEPRLLEWRSAERNIRFVLPEDDGSAREWLEEVGLAGCADQLPAVFSGGMRQRLSLARAFAVPAQGVLMDEPFQNLDLGAKLALCRKTRALHARRGGATLFVTHDVVEAALVSDQIVILSARPMKVVVTRENPLAEARRDPRDPALQAFASELYDLILSSSQQ